jgi:acetyl-CoA acetyltransferase
MSDVVISGVGMHPFGRFDDKSALELGASAIEETLADADTTWRSVDALFCGHMYAQTGAGQRITSLMGRTGIPVINVENACSSGGAALQMARQAVESGAYETAMAVGIEKMPRGAMRMDYFERWRGLIGHALNPAQFALGAQRHMHEHGTTERQLALVAVKNHRHSVHNDRAMYRHELSLEQVLASRMVIDPLRLLMLCSPNEGAAAALVSRRIASSGDVKLIGQGLCTAGIDQAIGEHMPTFSPITDEPPSHVMKRAADQAYEAAGVGPHDLDVLELQDTDSSSEIIATEQVGLCAPGEGGQLVESGDTSLGGRTPVNPSGGLLSKGEPVGASALGQVYEIVQQLRGRCGPRQVPGARTGMTLALGAGGNCSTLILQRA